MKAVAATLGAVLAMAVVATPVLAQDKEDTGHDMDHAKPHAMGAHTMQGTATPPEGETVDVTYEMSMGEDGMTGFIVGESEEGETIRVAMEDIEMEDGKLSYHFTPPDDATVTVSCVLERQDDGGMAGDCTDGTEGPNGHMTIAPMKEHMNPCAAAEHMEHGEHMDEMNPCAAEKHERHMEKMEKMEKTEKMEKMEREEETEPEEG